MKPASYRILLRKEPEGGYTVTVPALARARVTLRGTIDEAVAMAREALEVYIESLRVRGKRFRPKKGGLEHRLTVEVPG
ncbi:hypothetical protein DSECCO2_400700 [anaerobic digester metagenome]